ncbi:MAG: DUF308 domain-containing protein [Myxococcaceae bacterium]|nr:DUF308 domain-containing protein [Myxococcaceae bacterium]MCI0672556.1 DUF308 domain-containing protein [Myxococcaceae bacterium]
MAISEPSRTDVIAGAKGRATAAAWGAPFFLGLLLVALGVFAFIAAGLTSLASILFFGVLLFAGGVLEVIHAFRVRKEGRFLLYFLGGVLSLVVGALFFLRPLESLASVTLLLAAYFFASGLFRGITSVMDRYPGWGWDFFYGAVSVVLGVVLFAQWPVSSLWLLGVLVAAALIARGAAVMGASLALRRGLRAATA